MNGATVLVWLFSGCLPSVDSGTAVGNPTGMALDLAPAEGALVIARASTEVSGMFLESCDSGRVGLAVDRAIDLFAGDRLDADLRASCAIDLVFAGPMRLDGTAAGGATWSATLDVPSVSVRADDAFGAPATILRLGAPGWISASLFELGAEHVDVESGPVHDRLVRALTEGTALYADPGGGRCTGDACSGAPLGAAGSRADEDAESPDDDEDDDEDEDDDVGREARESDDDP